MIYEELIHQQNYWPLQIIQDEYGYALDIPLRIYNKSAVENLWEEISTHAAFSGFFSSEGEFHQYVKAVATAPSENMEMLKNNKAFWKEFFTGKREKSCWLTNQSSGYFLIHAFQDSSLWRWWEFFYYYHQFVVESNSGAATYFDCGEKHLHIVLQPISFTNQPDCVLVAGPVWEPINIIAGSEFEIERVTPLVESVLSIIDKKTTYERSLLVRLGNNRFPMSSQYLHNRLKRVGNCLNQVLQTELPTDARNIQRCDHAKLAEWSLFALQVHRRLPCDRISTQPCDNEMSVILGNGEKIYARLDHPQQLETDEGTSPWVETTWTTQHVPNFRIQYTEPPAQNRIKSLHVELPKAFNSACKEIFENSFTTFLNRIFARRSARKTGALLAVRKWLNDRFRVVTGKSDISEIYKSLCRWVADRVTADQVTLYYYNHGTKCLKKLGFYSKTTESTQWESIESIGKDKQQRDKCINYLCVDKRKVKFVRWFDPVSKRTIPTQEPMLLLKPHQSAIAAPILVHGRVWGVLEINGLYPHQFCWHNKTFLEELASIVSPFVYHQHLLYGLHKLNEIAVKKKNAKEMYWEIAHRLAVIFLSHSATLWNSEQQRDKYKCVGWYKNRLDVEQHDVIINNAVKAEDKITLCHNRSDVEQHNAIINNAVKAEGKITLCYNVAKDWIKSQPQEFQALKIKHFCVIPIYALNNKPIGSIFLYNQTNEGFGKRWLPEIDLVSKHVALLLEAMQMEQQKEQYMQKKVARNINFIAHDIKLYANLLKDRVISFKNYVSAEFKPNDKQKRRIHLLNYDVITDANDLVENIEWFISDANKSEGHDAVTQAQNVFDTAPLERLNFREQFNKVARSYWQVHKKTGVDIDDEWHDQEPYLNMHGSNLRKILLNLVSNAVKYTASATLPLIEAEFLADELEFKISNRAACLEEGEEFRLFEELFRGYHAESSGVEGTGQGLFIASEICKLYKIGLYYDSKIDPITNVGCLHTFTLSFPPKMLKLEKRR